jgi:hypothetical protein
MYDLTVAVAHTYLVGSGEWVVHNCSRGAAHGNSFLSTKPTHLYKAYDKASGEFLKWGVSSNLKKRYTNAMNVYTEVVKTGSRRTIHALETRVVRRFGGPLNREPWSRYMRD